MSCGLIFRFKANPSGPTLIKCPECGEEGDLTSSLKSTSDPISKNYSKGHNSASLTKSHSLLATLSGIASFFCGIGLYCAANPSLRALVYYPFPSLQNSWPPVGSIRTTFAVIAIILMAIGLAGILYGIITLYNAVADKEKR
jgi:hypothetical protein